MPTRIDYSQESLWNAIYAVIPGYKMARDAGCNINLPAAVDDAAVMYFRIGESGNQLNANIVRQALADLNSENCCFKFFS